ncbi:MAG: NAD(+)/NADH kinase [Eggerthellaceae bacterium]|jgi:NAD+ kinase|nr:NAD(+)/NADH kinase [Eggerthellaceae bacterium]
MHILIVRNNSNSGAIEASILLSSYLESQNIAFTSVDSFKMKGLKATDYDMAVVLGGDGTILRTASLIGCSGVPILGVNYGNLGFLANRCDEGVIAAVAAALSGEVTREQRSNLYIDVACDGDSEDAFLHACAGGDPVGDGQRVFALNEMAITRGASGRVIDFDLIIDGSSLASMRGDGLVVATATGSTAYALSAGGPLVAPEFKGLVVVPVAPHTLHARAVVTNPNDIVEVSLHETIASKEATLFADGEAIKFSNPITHIGVRSGSAPTILLRYHHEGFYAHAAKVFL